MIVLALVDAKCTGISERNDVVSVPLAPTEVEDMLEKREALSGSADCEWGMHKGCSAGTEVGGTESTT